MRNLAGHEQATEYCTEELKRCGIRVVEAEVKGEVPSRVIGKLGPFTFRRAWYYWVVKGPTPLHVAIELYANYVGKKDIRVDGHCGCPAPISPWITWCNPETGREIIEESRREGFLKTPYNKGDRTDEQYLQDTCDRMNWEFGDPQKGRPFVNCYHIDSELGLYIFVKTLEQHGVI